MAESVNFCKGMNVRVKAMAQPYPKKRGRVVSLHDGFIEVEFVNGPTRDRLILSRYEQRPNDSYTPLPILYRADELELVEARP